MIYWYTVLFIFLCMVFCFCYSIFMPKETWVWMCLCVCVCVLDVWVICACVCCVYIQWHTQKFGVPSNHRKYFFVKLTLNPPIVLWWNEKETKRKKITLKRNSNDWGEFGLVSWTKVAYGDFLKRPEIYQGGVLQVNNTITLNWS